ncbi:MAG TPA: LamG-like jellyroll fold domain-containing protein, partial [Cyclobacteriaceae bacterium]|nr:LamG-like jellyroll fold domain-containing protein [Cyclobacteriaceae bacterium]
YKNLNLPFTISAWVFLDPSAGASPIFSTNDNNPLYRGFWFVITPTVIECEFGDGAGGNNPAFRSGKIASISNVTGRWVHACAVMRSPFDISLYINGIDVGGSSSGQSNLTMASSFVGDTGKIGYFLSNDVASYFNGSIDEVRLWNRALSMSEIQQTMCKKLNGSEPGLMGYWNFDEVGGSTVIDNSPAKQNGGIIKGGRRVFSGAPIGDNSKYLYTFNWTGNSLSFQDGNDQVAVSNVQGNPEGVHVYEVKGQPSQTGGLDAGAAGQLYFGIFEASLDADNSFDATYTYNGSTTCKVFSRTDNSVSTWANSNDPIVNVLNRDEIIGVHSSQVAVFDLGTDKIICNQSSAKLSTGITDPAFSILWNTGQTTSSIDVSQSGKYVAKVSGLCGVVKDSVSILFESTPPTISLGDDQSFCVFEPITLSPLANSSGYEFTWQDNSHGANFYVRDFGKYWVAVKNDCGVAYDSITFSKYQYEVNFIPNVITPNGDELNQYFKVDETLVGNVSLVVMNRWGKEVYRSASYKNDWDGGGLSPGVYYIILSSPCFYEVRDTLTIMH